MIRISRLAVRIATVTAAVQRAGECRADPTRRAPPPRTPRRSVVLGDPQAPLTHLMAILAEQDLLSAKGWLRPTVQVVCVGDYVDYPSDDPVQAGLDGIALLAWLAAHDPMQTVLLIGNHDIERVCSLTAATPATMVAASLAAEHLATLPNRPARRAFLEQWAADHPGEPPIVAARDFVSWHPGQAPQYRRLLLAGRLAIAAVARVSGMHASALITHAGITRGWLERLGLPPDPAACARVLNRDLSAVVEAVRPHWMAGIPIPLGFAHHAAWEHLRPCSGLLSHRPRANPSEDRHHHLLGLDPTTFPRSLPPAEFLVPGLVQVVGHTRTSRIPKVVGAWHGREPALHAIGQPLTIDLTVDDGEVVATLNECLGHAVRSRIIYADVGLVSCAPAQVQVVGCEQVRVP